MTRRTADELRGIVEASHDHARCGESDLGLKSARGGTELLRKVATAKGRKAAVVVSKNAGFSDEDAETVVVEVSEGRPLPSGLVTAMLKKTSERATSVREAVCSNETGLFVDGSKENRDVTTAELMEAARNNRDPFKAFVFIARAVMRSVRAERIGQVGLYALSDAFVADMKAFQESSGKAPRDVADMFGLLDKIRDGKESKDERTRFEAAIKSRIETALEVKLDDRGISIKGTDGTTQIKVQGRGREFGVLYATSDSSAAKLAANSDSIRSHWENISSQGKPVRLFFVGSPIAPCDVSRLKTGHELGESNRPMAEIGLDLAKLQTALSLLRTDRAVVDGMLAGTVVAEGLYFSTGKPFVLDKNLFDETASSIAAIASSESRYPPSTERGRQAWLCIVNTIAAWAAEHPETFPWFEDKGLLEWLQNCPAGLRERADGNAATRAAILSARQTRQDAILDR